MATLAEALLRRKELQDKVSRLTPLLNPALYEVKVKRIKVTDSVDDVTATVPKLNLHQVTAEYDHYAKMLRLCDADIQRANWTTDMPGEARYFEDYKAAV